MKDKISVIVPIYNPGKYFENALNSLVNQTYENLEIILVDDGSTDDSPKLCDTWAEKDKRIKVIHKSNGGASSARNAGMDVATGDFIAFIDADDYIDLDMYEIMLNQILEHGADAASCGMVRESSDGTKEVWGSYHADEQIIDNTRLLQLIGEANGILPVSPCNKLFRKSVIKDVRFDERFKYAEDVLFNYYAAKSIDKIVVQNVPRYHYVSNENSTSHQTFDFHRFDEHKVMDIIFDDCKSNIEVLKYCIKGDILKSFRTIKEMMASDNETDKFCEIRSRIVKNKDAVFSSGIYGKATKIKVLFLWLMPNLYKKFIKVYAKRNDAVF